MEIIPIKTLLSFIPRCLPFIARILYSKARLEKLMYVDISPRNTSVELNLGIEPTYQAWMQVINLSPFDIEIDRSEITMSCASEPKALYVKKIHLQPGEIKSFNIAGKISPHTATMIARDFAQKEYSCHLTGDMEINCKVHNFSKRITLDGIYPRVQNREWRILNPATAG